MGSEEIGSGIEGPMFSVLIPAYNVAEYLGECLESVLKQSYVDWEAVVIDDGSTDSTGQICDRFAKKDIRFKVFHQKNQGISVTRNRLIELSKGAYIIFLDSDDYWIEKDLLQAVYNEIIKNKVEIVAWWAKLLDNETKQVQNCQNCIPVASEVLRGEEFVRQMTKNGLCRWWSFLYAFERTLWDQCHIAYKEGRVICEDAEVLYQVLLKAERICALGNYFYCYRIGREASLTGQFRYSKLRDMMEVSALNIQNVRKMELSTDLKDDLCGNFAYMYMESAPQVFGLGKKERKEGAQMMLSYKWIVNYYKDFGSLKNRMKIIAYKIFGVRISLWLIYICQRIMGY
jgi:glycosyltransferase involved in cell wall biosynthesis